MIKYFNTVSNERGDVLANYRVQVVDSLGASVDIFADAGGTRFTDSGGNIVNYTEAQPNGRIAFYWTPADGQVLQTLDASGNLVDAEADFANAFVLANLPGNIGQDAVTNLVPDLAAKTAVADLASTAAGKGAALVGTTGGESVQDVLDRADKPLTVTEGPNRVIAANNINDAAAGLSAVTISGGGSVNDENYIGFQKNRATLSTTGTAQVWPYLPTNNNLANLRLIKLTASNVHTTLTSPTHYSAAINGAQVDITLVTGLTSGERLIVEDKAAKVAGGGVAADYGIIAGGYDNHIFNGVMQTVAGAHHRVEGGDHGTILGGSYAILSGGSYGLIAGGTNNEITSAGGVGSVVLGGYRNKASGATSTIVGGQSNKASGAQSFIGGGTLNTASGTASAVFGRNNTVAGSDSFIAGDGNTNSGNYSSIFGRSNSVTHQHSHAKGYGAVSSWQGQDIRFAYRDGGPLVAQRQHFFLDLSLYTAGTTSALMQLLSGSTAITPPVNTIWKCKLQVSARGGNLKGATFDVEFSIQRNATTTTLIAAPVVTSVVDVGMGTAANAATVTVAIVSNAIEVTAQPRLDVVVGTKWHGVLEVVEVA